jgi:LacI family transcriptional regulator
MKEKNLTLNDIALELNVSPVTVSKALRNHPDISVKTSERIKRKVEELGYIPNYFARNLAARKTNLIGLTLPNFNDRLYSELADTIFSRAISNHYKVVLMISQNKLSEEEAILSAFYSMKVEGIIFYLEHSLSNNPLYRRIISSDTPLLVYRKSGNSFNLMIKNVNDKNLTFDFSIIFPQLGIDTKCHLKT